MLPGIMRTAALSEWEQRFFAVQGLELEDVHKSIGIKCWI